MVLAMREHGVDPTDQAAVERFIAEVNSSGGLDHLVEELSKTLA
jgi:hypothetical protein